MKYKCSKDVSNKIILSFIYFDIPFHQGNTNIEKEKKKKSTTPARKSLIDIPLPRAAPSPSSRVFRISSGLRFHYHANSISRYHRNKRVRTFCSSRQICTASAICSTLTPTVSTAIKQSVGTSHRRSSARKSSLSSPLPTDGGMSSPFGDRPCSADACRRKLRHGLALRRTNRNGPGGGWLLDRMRKRGNDGREFVVRPRTTVAASSSTVLDHRRISPATVTAVSCTPGLCSRVIRVIDGTGGGRLRRDLMQAPGPRFSRLGRLVGIHATMPRK